MPPQNPEQARWFTEKVQPHGPSLRAYLLGRFPSLPDVDDMVQECLVRVVRAAERSPVPAPRALLFATARNLAIDVLRRQKVVSFEPITEIADSSVFMDGLDVPDLVSKQQELDLLTQAIQSLPTKCRQVVTLRTAFALSQKEIAARLGISENTVEKQLAKGFHRCSEFLFRHGLP